MNQKNETENRKDPFISMKIDDDAILDTIKDRSNCIKCTRSRKYFCYTCFIPVPALENRIPNIKLPVKIDIIKHKQEIDGKSTAAHAPLLASEDCRIFKYPNIPDYDKEEGVVLIFPCSSSVTISQIFDDNIEIIQQQLPKGFNMGTLRRMRVEEAVKITKQDKTNTNDIEYTKNNLPIKRAVLIDSTWNQCRGIFKDKRISSLKSVVLQNRMSHFWRHQRGSPRWYLATIEAIHEFLLEVHVRAWGINSNYKGIDEMVSDSFFENIRKVEQPVNAMAEFDSYNGQYDNLLYFFKHMYGLIHLVYDHNLLKSYKRPF